MLAAILGVFFNAESCASILGVISDAGLCAINNWCERGADIVLFYSNELIDAEIDFNFATMNSSSYAETFCSFFRLVSRNIVN